MVYTCPNCSKAFAHASSLCRHRKVCGGRAPRLSCPHCAITFTRASDLKRHVGHSCKKGNKRPTEHTLPENPKRPLVDYSSSEEELLHPEPEEQSWRVPVKESSDEEPWRVEEPEESSDEDVEAPEETLHIEEVPLHVATHTEEEEIEEPEEESHNVESLNLNTLKKALPWDKYLGMGEKPFAAATQQTGGNPLGPLFDFQFFPVSSKQWKGRVNKTVYQSHLHQNRAPEDSDDIGVVIVNALDTATHQHLAKIGARKEDRVFLAITPHGFEHTYQTKEFTVREFLAGSTRLDQLFRKLAGKLNSNESFTPQQGFQLDLTLVRPFGRGSGREKGLNSGRMGYELSRQMKKSIIEIKNKDKLCCARAIVTVQARAEWKMVEKKVQEEEKREVPDQVLLETLKVEEKSAKKNYETIRRTPIEKKKQTLQKTLAKQLHQLAGVAEGPCSIEELKKFQAFLSTLTPPYQLKVFCDVVKTPVYTGPIKTDKDHILVLIKSENHYDGCGSLTGFLSRSYYCHECDRAFNTNDPAHHTCLGRICKACGLNPCPDQFQKRDLLCEDCHGLFYGPTCFQTHKSEGTCDKYHTCLTCFAEYKTDKDHHCWEVKCRNCGELDDLTKHKCYIQPVEEEEGKPPLFVYADIEAMIMPDRTFRPNLLCYQTSKEKSTIHPLWGEDCCDQFIRTLNSLARVPVGKKKTKARPVMVLFHNLKGFDGMFIMEALYRNAREVTDQFCMGAKVLCFKSGSLTFKDSLCFLPFPLSAFPATFGLKELKKGYFPHSFNTPEHQSYKGRIPAMSYYDPDGMKVEEKKFEKWYSEQRGVYDFEKELLGYCKSDVELLKRGCEAFVKQFKKEANFNPFEKCSTIASACNLYWRCSIKEDTDAAKIAVRPLRGWHGAQVNQSQAALQWLAYRESLLPHEGASADRIRHAKNGGEKTLFIENGPVHVDGWDAATNTAYEFMGCLWHGCPSCYPRRRDLKHSIMPDRTPNEAYRATQEKLRRLREDHLVVEMWE